MRIASLALASSIGIFAVACAAPTEVEPAEEVAETDQALMNTGGGDPLLGSVCRACGCSYVARKGSDGCTTYRCECATTEQANCVIRAPGGGSATLTTSPVKTTYATSGTLYLSP